MNPIMQPTCPRPQQQRGMSLIVILLLLVIVSMLGVASMQIAGMGERGARNDRDMQLATQSAEAALIDAEIDIQGIWQKDANGRPIGDDPIAGSRAKAFKAGNAKFPGSGCNSISTGGTSTDPRKGLCALETDANKKPVWQEADFESEGSTEVVSFGDFTGRNFKNAGTVAGTGVQPALPPRYIIENVSDLSAVRSGMVTGQYASAVPEGGTATGEQLYRVTAMGFGPRSTTHTVLQTIYRN